MSLTSEEKRLIRILEERKLVDVSTLKECKSLKEHLDQTEENWSFIELLVQIVDLHKNQIQQVWQRVQKEQEKEGDRSDSSPSEPSNQSQPTPSSRIRFRNLRRRRLLRRRQCSPSGISRKKSTGQSDSRSSPGNAYSSGRSGQSGRDASNYPSSRHEKLKKSTKQFKDKEGINQYEPIPGYKIHRFIAKGGEATVFQTVKSKTGDKYALKLLFPEVSDQAAVVERFLREGRHLVEFDHPNILAGYHFGDYLNLHYQVLELVEGVTGLQFIQNEGSVEEEFALRIIFQLAKALQYMQQHGVIHRDVKPKNFMIREDGLVKLFDLGIARSIHSKSNILKKSTFGTAAYMSPEQTLGKTNIDIRSDIYSLGISLFHLVTGGLPFVGKNNKETLKKQVNEPMTDQKFRNTDVSESTRELIKTMTRKVPEQRFKKPLDVIKALQGLTL